MAAVWRTDQGSGQLVWKRKSSEEAVGLVQVRDADSGHTGSS